MDSLHAEIMEVESMEIDGADERKPLKRKRSEAEEEKLAKISEFRNELNNLVKYCKNLASDQNSGAIVGSSSASLNGVVACLMEESDHPLSKLVDDIFEKVKGRNGDGVSKACVKRIVLEIGKRSCYGVSVADADVLEDDDESALWFWETRDLKLMPTSARASLRARRICRKKIHERITAVSAMINALEKSENNPNSQQELVKASENLSKALNESEIRSLMESISQKNCAEMAEKEAEREQKLKIKQSQKQKKELDREKKKKELQSEKELKLLHGEADKEKQQLKRQQEEAEKAQRRKEKEEAELKKRLAIQKQASLMERFLKGGKNNSSSQIGKKATTPGSSSNVLAKIPESVTQAMDSAFAQKDEIEVQDIWRSHLNAWRSSRFSTHSNRKRRWGIRQKPKTEQVKELKLKELTSADDFSIGWEDPKSNTVTSSKKGVPVIQLLQFDQSNRPAFYGVWPSKSQVVGARRPFVKDPDVEYDIDSDEEWEEDEPGESLSDCDKDDDDDEDHLTDGDGDESDGFFVPDGYLSENEGVAAFEVDHDLVKVDRNPSNEFCTSLRQQKYLNNLTEHALKKNQPLIMLNLAHEKTSLESAEELTGIPKIERTALQALRICPFPGSMDIEISVPNDVADDDQNASSSKSSTALLDPILPEIISIIQSSALGMRKMEKVLHDKFPAFPRSLFRNKVREIADFSGNGWQVKKEILSKFGMNASPEKSGVKTTSIATFLEKRCHPGETSNMSTTSPQSSLKLM